MRVMIFESQGGGGHRLTYVRQMLGALHDLPGVEPVLALGEGLRGAEEFDAQLGAWEGRVPIAWVPVERAGFAGVVGAMREAIDTEKPDTLLVPTADGLAQTLSLHPGALKGLDRADLVVHSAAFALPSRGLKLAIKRKLALMALGRQDSARIRFVNGLAMDWLEARGHRLARTSSVLPDPVDVIGAGDKAEGRAALGLAPGVRLMVSPGQQNERKGVHLLVEAFGVFCETNDDGMLGLFGKCSEGVRARLEALPDLARERVHVVDRYIDDAELQHALASADVVANCSPHHIGLSNVALRAAAAERPVLAADRGWLGRMVPRHGLGWAVDPEDIGALSRAIATALDGAPSWAPTEATRRLVSFHSPKNFRATVRSWYSDEAPTMTWAQLRDG